MPDPLWINADAGSPAYTANEMRQPMALAMAYDGRAVGARAGVRPGGTQLQVSLAVSTITVATGVALVDPGLSTAQGPYWVAIPTAEQHTLAAADATNPRKDIVILRVYDDDEDSSGQRTAVTEYLVGVPGPAPAEPALPAGAIRLATIDVPLSGGGAAVVTDRRPYTVAAGAILPVRNQAERDALSPWSGMRVWRIDESREEVWTGAAWRGDAMIKQEFTANGTWTKPAGARSVRVIVQGGGGAGGGAAATGASEASMGSGGAAGACTEAVFAASALSASVAVTRGAGGAGASGAAGNAGGTSSFGAFATANGGAGGTTRPASTVAFGIDGPAGQATGTGGTVHAGGPGGAGWGTTQLGISGAGGTSRHGGGGQAVRTTSGSQTFAGNAGVGHGAGGSGAINSASVSAATGGAGKNGIIIVETYF